MAIFLHEDVRSLLWEKMVIIIGDSVQRAVYKDLVCLLVEKDSRYLSNSELRSKGELSFLGDELLSGGQLEEMTNGKSYKETRRFDSGHTIVKFYFVTRCFSEHVQSILDEVKQFPPHVIIMNSCLWDLHRYGLHGLAAFKVNLGKLMFALNSTLNSDCVFIWNATLPLASKCKGGFLLPLFDTIPSLEIMEANFFARSVMSSSKRLFLDLHAIFSQQLHHRAKDGVHWDKVAHRRITNLLLTELSRLWNVAVPRRPRIEPLMSSPNSWNNLFQPVTPTRPGLLPTPRGILPTPPSRNNSMINCSYTSLLGQMFHPATPVHPLSASFSGQTGFLNKYIVDSGALSDGNDYEDVETAREYKQRFRFGATSSPVEKTNTVKNHQGNTHDQISGPNGEKPKSGSRPVDSKIYIDKEGKQSNENNVDIGECPAGAGNLPAVQTDAELSENAAKADIEQSETAIQTDAKLNETDSELNQKTREFESDVQLYTEHANENDVRPIPRSSSFTCTPIRSSSLADTSDLHTDYYRDAQENEVDTHFVDNQHSFSEDPIRSSTPCLAKQPIVEQNVYNDSHSNQVNIDLGYSEAPSIEETRCDGVLPECSSNKESVGDFPVEKKVEETICSSVVTSGDSDLCGGHTCYSVENVSAQLECDSTVDEIRSTSVVTNDEEVRSMKDSHCTRNSDKNAVGKETELDLEKDTRKPKTPSNEIQSLPSRGKKRKNDTLEENSRHKKVAKSGDGSKLKTESLSPKKVCNKVTSEKERDHKKRRREECREHRTFAKSVVVEVDTNPCFVQGELQDRSEKRQRNKERQRNIASNRTSSKTRQVGCERRESSLSGTAGNFKVVSSRPRHISSGRTGNLKNRESKKMVRQDVVYKNVATNNTNLKTFRSEKKQKEEPLLESTKCVSDGRTTTSDVRLNRRDAGRRTTCSSYSTGSETRDSNTRAENAQPVPVLSTSRQEISCFRKPKNPTYKGNQSRPKVSRSHRYNPYQYQHQHPNQQYIQQYQHYQQQTSYNCTRGPVLCRPQIYSQDQQRAGNMYINANHPAMRQTVAEWERLMSFYGHSRYY